MYTYKELEEMLLAYKKKTESLALRVEALEKKIQGDGVILLFGNRFKLDKSGSISEYQLKTN
jgi:hypothetical protein